jgi:hypothetical protein
LPNYPSHNGDKRSKPNKSGVSVDTLRPKILRYLTGRGLADAVDWVVISAAGKAKKLALEIRKQLTLLSQLA